MRFNPPPGWPPVPHGWTPPNDWQPDPSWPPVPPGWPLWVPDQARRRTGLIVGAALAGTAVVIAVVIALVLTVGNSGDDVVAGTSAGTSTTTVQPSDEDQIQSVIDAFEQAWNDDDFAEMTQIVCTDMRESSDFNESAFAQMREVGGDLVLTVNSIDVTGDKAVAIVAQRGEDADDIAFLFESGEWKWCEF